MPAVGVVLPHRHVGDSTERLLEIVQGAERMGCRHLNVYDHVLGAVHDDRVPPLTGPYTQLDPFREPLVLFGYLAAATTSIELCTAVLVLPQRQAALVAKQAAEVDLLSGGRLRLGVGAGWNHVEYESLGQEFETRGRRLDDQIALLRELWSEAVVDHRSEWHRVDRAGILPRPTRAIPVWVGGFADVALRRAARLGDGFIASSAEDIEARAARLRVEAARAGRDPAGLGLDVQLHLDRGIDALRVDHEACLRAGATHVTLALHRLGTRTSTELLDALQTAMEAIA